MGKKFFTELSRRLYIDGIESSAIEDNRLEISLHGQPTLYVSPGNDVFLLPAGSKNEEASELYHQVAMAADEVYSYVETMQNAPLLHAPGLHEDFRLLADFGGAVLAGQERENGQGYQFVTWIWDYDRTGVSHGHYYEDDFQSAKQDFAVRSGLIPRAQLFTPEELTELYRAAEHWFYEGPELDYWGDYPYMIEDNYFNQGNLETQPGEYRQTTVEVNSFSPNAWGLYNMHGNVGEWAWDYYGAYNTENQTDPTGPETGTRRVYRGGGWNDFAKNLRSAYRAALPQENSNYNIGIRLVRNAVAGTGNVTGAETELSGGGNGEILIAYFSWGGNTRGIAEEIQRQTGADLFEIQLVEPYSTDYNTVLDQAQQDQNEQARPELSTHVENMEQYDTIILGYPNWWASIPMPIASFLEEYDFSDKTILPFCSHGGGGLGQSQTAIAKLVPNAIMAEGLAINYSGGSGMPDDVAAWLQENGII